MVWAHCLQSFGRCEGGRAFAVYYGTGGAPIAIFVAISFTGPISGRDWRVILTSLFYFIALRSALPAPFSPFIIGIVLLMVSINLLAVRRVDHWPAEGADFARSGIILSLGLF